MISLRLGMDTSSNLCRTLFTSPFDRHESANHAGKSPVKQQNADGCRDNMRCIAINVHNEQSPSVTVMLVLRIGAIQKFLGIGYTILVDIALETIITGKLGWLLSIFEHLPFTKLLN